MDFSGYEIFATCAAFRRVLWDSELDSHRLTILRPWEAWILHMPHSIPMFDLQKPINGKWPVGFEDADYRLIYSICLVLSSLIVSWMFFLIYFIYPILSFLMSWICSYLIALICLIDLSYLSFLAYLKYPICLSFFLTFVPSISLSVCLSAYLTVKVMRYRTIILTNLWGFLQPCLNAAQDVAREQKTIDAYEACRVEVLRGIRETRPPVSLRDSMFCPPCCQLFHHPIQLSIYPSIYPSIYLSIYLSIYIYI